MKNYRRASSNMIATMFIFSIMITSMGVLYAQISPTLLGFQGTTASTNQEFIFQTVVNEIQDLTIASDGSQSRVHIISDDTQYDVNAGTQLSIAVNTSVAIYTGVENIGLFQAMVSGTFSQQSQPDYLNRIANEDTYIQNDTKDESENYVAKGEFETSLATFSLYFRSRLTLVEYTPGNWIMTIVMIKFDFFKAIDDSALDFPIERGEWTLRLRRLSSNVTILPSVTTTGPVSVSQSIDGISGTQYNYNIPVGDSLTVKFITVPILFSI